MSTAVPVPVLAVLTAVMNGLTLVAGQHAFRHERCLESARFADELIRSGCFSGIRCRTETTAFHAGATIEARVVNANVTAIVQRDGAAAALLLLVDVMAAPPAMATSVVIGRNKGAMPKR